MPTPPTSDWIDLSEGLDPRVVRVWTTTGLVTGAIAIGLLLAAAGVVRSLGANRVGLALVGAALIAAITTAVVCAVWPRRRFARFRWEMRPEGLIVRQGWLWEVVHIVPHARIQAVDARSGPLERRHGLATLHLRTASATGSPRIPGLDRDLAGRLAAEIARRAGAEDAT